MAATTILKLRDSGFTDAQVSALAELIDTQAATKPDLEAIEQRLTSNIKDTEHRLDLKIANVTGELRVLKWMTGANLAFVLAVLVKLFIK